VAIMAAVEKVNENGVTEIEKVVVVVVVVE
jgi:hypothetical protein